jgi:cold shock CspA family protein
MRVGTLARVVADKQFGFIRADEFRDDVFFHFSVVSEDARPEKWEAGFEVEFEINDFVRREENLLRATIVQPSSRPLSHSLDNHQASKFLAAHHPRARQSKPSWRKRDNPGE